MFKIISDGGCDFSAAEAEKHGVEVIPFYIMPDADTYLREGTDITKEEYFKRLAAEKNFFPKTAQPNPQDYIDAYTPYLRAGKDILSLTISSKLSGSFNSATLAAQMLAEEFPERRIVVVDSLNASIGQGLILREIIRMRDAGFNLKETTRTAREVLKTTRVYFTLDTLEYLKKGGRIGSTTAFVGGILGLRPILQLENGEVSQLDNVRGRKNAYRLIEGAITHALAGETEKINICVGHISSAEDAENFKANISAALNLEIKTPVTEVGAAIGTHAGPGALAFAYCRKYENICAGGIEKLREAA